MLKFRSQETCYNVQPYHVDGNRCARWGLIHRTCQQPPTLALAHPSRLATYVVRRHTSECLHLLEELIVRELLFRSGHWAIPVDGNVASSPISDMSIHTIERRGYLTP